MKIDLTKEILNRKGETITSKVKVPFVTENSEGEVIEEQRFKAVTLTLGKLLIDAVLSIMGTAGDMDDKIGRYNLYLRIEEQKVVDLSQEDIDKLKIYVADKYEVLYCGQVVELLS